MSYSMTGRSESYVFWDTVGSGVNPVAPYQIVSLADSSEVAAALAAGCRDAKLGRLVVVSPTGTVLGATVNTRRIVGVTKGAAWSGDEVMVQCSGIAEVMVNAAVAIDALLFGVARATRTSAQTPITNLPQANLPVDPKAVITYQLMMADDAALTFNTTGSNVPFWPLGHALEAATAQYDVIPVELQLGVLHG